MTNRPVQNENNKIILMYASNFNKCADNTK